MVEWGNGGNRKLAGNIAVLMFLEHNIIIKTIISDLVLTK